MITFHRLKVVEKHWQEQRHRLFFREPHEDKEKLKAAKVIIGERIRSVLGYHVRVSAIPLHREAHTHSSRN